jgi:[acyl-carrier-protein] S-malonyltransferase
MTIVYMFPGQNSRYTEMIDRQREWSGCERILQDASDVLGRDLSAHYRAENAQMFCHNRDVQIGVFLAAYILGETLAAAGIRSAGSLGLSLGEYNHLVEIGALSFASALRILEARGLAYENGPRGLMMSVLPCDESQVQQALDSIAAPGSADIAIELSAKHFVISGEARHVQAAASWLEDEAFAQARVVDSALPMHSRMFRPAADAFLGNLEKADWRPAQKPYLPNVDGQFLVDARPAELVDRLYRHVFSTVRWSRSVAAIVDRYPNAVLVEVGPKCILYNTVRRDYKHLHCFRTDDPESTDTVLLNTIERLQEVHSAA